jgi:hypothetical protein
VISKLKLKKFLLDLQDQNEKLNESIIYHDAKVQYQVIGNLLDDIFEAIESGRLDND